jgi:hypothetical protein
MKNHLTFIALLIFSNLAFGQQNNNPESSWEITAAPYLLLGSLSGESTVGVAGPAEVDADFGDILKNLQFAFMVHGEAFNGNWGLITDFIYLKLGSDISTPVGGILDAEVRESILEVFASHRLKKDWGWIDLYGGIRWWDIGMDLQLDGFLNRENIRDEGWVDPVIGGRIYYNTSSKIVAGLRADIGGFGVGSDFSLNIQPGIGYRFSDSFTLMLQYKYLDTDYDNGKEGRELFALDAATSGPIIGFVLQF